jgi:hypothetical protein
VATLFSCTATDGREYCCIVTSDNCRPFQSSLPHLGLLRVEIRKHAALVNLRALWCDANLGIEVFLSYAFLQAVPWCKLYLGSDLDLLKDSVAA